MRFIELARTYRALEGVTSRKKIRATLVQLFRKVPIKEIDEVALLTTGRIANEYEGIDLGVAGKSIIKSIALATNKRAEAIALVAKKLGDIGTAAERALPEIKPSLDVSTVFETLHRIASASGTGSQQRRFDALASLLRRSTPIEAKYIARIANGNLRLGVGDKAVLDALAEAYGPGSKALLDRAYTLTPDIGVIARTIATKGTRGITRIGVTVGIPVQMMLCQRVKDLAEVPRKLGTPFTIEEKYDGERIQAHKRGDRIMLFSRRLENITSQFPDVVETIGKRVKAREAIIEGEAVAVDAKGNQLPFQVLMQRRRKHDVAKYAERIPIRWFVFDVLALNGKSLIDEPYPKRQSLLQKIVREDARMQLALQKQCSEPECIDSFFTEIVQLGGEGVVIKSRRQDSTYQAGVRGWHWVKWKPEYSKALRDTFDLVVVGAYAGRGRRAGRYGALLCAAYNPKTESYDTFCKVGTGLTDSLLDELPRRLSRFIATGKPGNVSCTKAMAPDVWFTPKMVIEVSGAQITRSPNHTVGLDRGQGLALRFPRFLRFRDDKKPEQATTVDEIRRMLK